MVRSGRARPWRSAAARRLLQMSGAATVDEAVETLSGRLVPCDAQLPIAPEQFFDLYGIVAAQPDNTLPYTGKLERAPDGFRIRYAANMRATRRRFTLAHELCHAVFAASGPGWPRGGRELEEICEMFAAALLMPEWAVRKTWSAQAPSFDAVLRCGEALDVSLTALAKRLAQFDIAIVLHELDKTWWPLGRAARLPQLAELSSEALYGDHTLLIPGVFRSSSAVRFLVGPTWNATRHALLLPTSAGRAPTVLDRAELDAGLALVREALERSRGRPETMRVPQEQA